MSEFFSADDQSWLDLRPAGGLRYRQLTHAGDGPLILFVHAASLCAGVWGPVLSHGRPNWHAVAYDQRGHGDSDAPPATEQYDWRLFGNDFAAIVEAVSEQAGRPIDACVTHSFAGDCAVMALAERSIPIDKLIMLDPVLADQEGATVGAQRLAKGTLRLGEREESGFATREDVGEALEKVLRAQLEREGLDARAKAAFAAFGAAADEEGRLHLKCKRQNEAAVYLNRVAIADFLADKEVDAEVHLIFSKRRRAKPEDQQAAYARDWEVARGVTQRCRTGEIHPLEGVGHFLVLEAPEVVAATLCELI